MLIHTGTSGRPRAASARRADPASASPREGDAGTRDRILRSILERGPISAAQLAAELGITSTAVRRHLDSLQEAGDIRTAPAAAGPRGRGRPARSFVATSAAHHRLASEYDEVATAALRFLAEQVGPDAVAAFAKRRIASLEERYGEVVRAAGPDVRDRAQALAEALARDGFAATARPLLPLVEGTGAEGVQLCQGHCPMHEVAREFPEFCEAETDAFARLLGVHVQRLATLAGGGHVCTTYVPHSAVTLAASAPATATAPAPATAPVTGSGPQTPSPAPAEGGSGSPPTTPATHPYPLHPDERTAR